MTGNFLCPTRTLLIGRISAVILLSLLLGLAAQAQERSDVPLTNLAVIKLVKAGFKEKTVIAIINSRPNHFQMDTEQLIQLKHNGVSENIILAMLSINYSADESDDWSDDAFLSGSKPMGDQNSGGSQGNSADIFGSSSGSKSQTKQRGVRGSNDNNGSITGSATVRIIRPPAEAGGTPSKLERTPTLNNESVIRLVEAGFSEGTIIKRIEESPAEFDLSPSKIDELHKRRVTDPVISAMTAAMGDKVESKPAQTPEREN